MSTQVRRPTTTWVIPGLEVALAAVVIIADIGIPSLVVLVLAGLSLALRRHGPATLGFHRLPNPGRTAMSVLGIVVVWTVLQLGLFIPVIERLTGRRQEMSTFGELQGNLGLLLALLVLSWALGALCEEAVFRGYLQARINDVLGSRAPGVLAAVLVSSVLFALIHTEQGVVGVLLTFLDALLFSALRWHYGSVWAPVLAHGFSNTIGITAFFLVGPIYGLW